MTADLARWPDEAARIAYTEFRAEQRQNPAMLPYAGPENTVKRFLAGDVVTKTDFLTDTSLWTIKALLPEQMRRLQWMLDNLTDKHEGER